MDDPLIDLYFPGKNKKELPGYIKIVTISGIICLAIAFVISLVLSLGYEQPKNNDQVFKSSSSRNILIILIISFGVLGFVLSCFVFYGHYLRNRYDPKNIIKGPINIISFPNIDKDIKVNDFREGDLKPRYYFSDKKRLRNDFL